MRCVLTVAVAVALFSAGCWGGGDGSEPTAPTRVSAVELAQAVTQARLRGHLQALQRIADENGGTRASGTPGYDASVDYVVRRLRQAGYAPHLQRFTYTDSRELERPGLSRKAPDPATFDYGDDFVGFRYSGSGEVVARVEPVDVESESSGCEASDFSRFEQRSVALIRRGGCFFFVKVRNAAAAGAAAVLVFNDGSAGHEAPLEATLLRPAKIPALSLANSVGEELARSAEAGPVRVRVQTHVAVRKPVTANVLADLRGVENGPPLLLGAHLDSIESGPGINDNGSGVATVLELATDARRLGLRPRQPVRFAFWAAEEAGLVGSTRYVKRLGSDADREIAAVVNLDMVGSPNAEAFVYEGDGTIEKALMRAIRQEGFEPLPLDLEGRSDHAPFAEAGIPVGGMFSGADEPGPGGRPHDSCYHRPCDTLENVDFQTLERMADALALAVFGDLTTRSS
jgi:Zn-dependent M28 family amino/carboxypeptidase